MNSFKRILVSCLLFCGLFLSLSDAFAGNKGIAFRTGIQPMNVSRFVLETEKEPEYAIFYLDNPKRIVIDINDLDISDVKKATSKTGFISDIRSGVLDDKISRFVLDLSAFAKIKKHFVLKPLGNNKNYRLVIDIESASENEFAEFISKNYVLPSDVSLNDVKNTPSGVVYEEVEIEVTDSSSASSGKQGKFSKKLEIVETKTKSSSNKNNTSKNDKKKVIVIDAGHGGQDPGAIGLGGTYEKNIVLAMAKQLRDVLSKNSQYKIILTRETDKFIKLQERARIAERNNATIFISIHADSSPKKTTKGFSVYTLSEKATDEESKKIAEKENAADLLGIGTFDSYDPITKNILGDLMQTQVKIASVEMANEIVAQVKQDVVCVDNPHREAPFMVLRSAVPSVLVEMGFLSNRDEEKKLNQKWYREKLAYSLARAIDSILKE